MGKRRHDSLVALSRDHHAALSLAFRLHHPSPPGPATAMTPPSTVASRAAEVVEFFAAHLEGHFRAEEEVLFPVVGRCLAAGDPAVRLLSDLVLEHRRLEDLRDAIAAAPARGLAELLVEFADVLERHVRAEERLLFVRFGEIVPEPEAMRIGPEIQAVLDARPPAACRV